jgi:ribonuclease G
VRESRDDDFFVLPGESLAKYTEPSGVLLQEGVLQEDVLQEVSLEEGVAGPPVEPVEEAQEPEAAAEPVAEAVAEPEPEPKPVAVAQPDPEPEVVAAKEMAVATAEKLDEPVAGAAPVEAAAPVAESPVAEEAEAFPDAEGEAAEPEPASEVDGEEAAELADEAVGEGEPIVEPEGPEPARIPTSLTAALREQNPRYLQHRVSRRMRRKGGRPDDRGPRPEGGRPPQGEPRAEARTETRTQEARGDARPEQRTEQRTGPNPRGGEARLEKPLPSISDLLKEGQEIIVQIAKEPLGQKGARITSHIALPGRFLVYMPTVDHIGVSRKIPSDDERLRLKRILQSNRTGIPGGYIVRTAGDGRTEEELRADMMFLYNLWLDMRQKAERRPAPLLIHHDLNVVERILRDQLTSSFKSIWVDNEDLYESVLGFVQRFQPAMVGRVKLYTRSTPIFDEFNITSELEKALRPKVWLKSGGYIVINQTEALVAIDINTGKYVGKSNRLEDTIVKTNTDAIKEIVRQIRLRDLGGIIVVDFIDMDERKNRQKVMQALEEAMRADRAPYKILQFNDFGLVAITRKRVKQSLERTLCTPCPYCEGAGYVKSPQTVVGEILQEAHKISRAVEGKDVLLRVSPEVAKLLKSNQNSYLPEIEEILGGRTVIVKSDSDLHQEKFDLA